ncbi:MAG: hypothetical protein H7Z74_02145 [Anaerolineae bacterium]|nr:hypothetical protein [Gemmatimonadaceae bacterium]
MTSPYRSPVGQRNLALIRISLLIGVLMFGAFTWWLQRAGDRPPSDPSTLRLLRIEGFVVWGASIALLAFLRARVGKSADLARPSYLVVSWIVAEAVALFGGVVYFLSGDARWYIAGLFFMIAAFLLFPLRRA